MNSKHRALLGKDMSDIDMNSPHPSLLVELSRAKLNEIPKTLHRIVTSDIAMDSSHPSILVGLSRAKLNEILKALHQIVTQRVQTRTNIALYYGTDDTNFAKSLTLAITYGATLQN